MKGYKAFNKGLICKDYQFEVGKEHVHEGKIELCGGGFHFCENPLDVLSYYPLIGSEFAEIEAVGKVVTKDGENKHCTDRIIVKTKFDLRGLAKASVDFIWERAKKGGIFKKNKATTAGKANAATAGNDANAATAGNAAHAATAGNDAHAATAGNYANAATAGYAAHAATAGVNAIACAVGRQASAKGTKGCWLVIAEWQEANRAEDIKPIGIVAVQVDGKKVKENVFYKVKGGKLVESEV